MERKGKLLNDAAGFPVWVRSGLDGERRASGQHFRCETVGYRTLDPRPGGAAVSRKPAVWKEIDGVRIGRPTGFDQLLHDGHQRERSVLRSEGRGMQAVNGITCHRPARAVVV